jgi:hypothetical protein
MQKRVPAAILTAALTVVSVAGCQSITPGTLTRTQAQTDVAAWTRDAETALGSPTSAVRFDGYETCRSDHGYFTTSSEWRTVTSLGVPRPRQSAAISTLSAAFVGRTWSTATSSTLVRLSGPKGARHLGLIEIERGGAATLVITVISPCYS